MIFFAYLALLSPYYQSIVEIKSLLESPELEKHLGEKSALQSITKNETGYLIQNGEESVQVDVEEIPRDMIGPIKFKLTFKKIS